VAFVLLGEVPGWGTLAGGALIVVGVIAYTGLPRGLGPSPGVLLGAASSLSYALAYSLRRLGMAEVPDPALGGLIGALAGVVLLPLVALPRRGLASLVVDRSGWHWLAALSLGAGQTLQFFALQSASVTRVAVLGALDLVFAAVLAAVVFRTETLRLGRFLIAVALAGLGTAILFA
jgi:drug/metabolite transporter (DMT)-like permease